MPSDSVPKHVSINGPCSIAGRFVFRYPWIAVVLVFGIAWTFRSFVFAGDGDQIARFIEAGYWMVQSELLTQMTFQFVHQILGPWGWDGLASIQLVTCIAAAICVWLVLRFNREIIGVDPLWPLGLLFSTCFLILAAGHTEYYTQLWIGLLYYGMTGVMYLNHRCSILWVGLAFSLGVFLHMGMLFAFPSILALPLIHRKHEDYKTLLTGLAPAFAAFLFKEYSDVLGIRIQGLSPSTNFVPMFEDPIGTRFYFMFQWGHWLDILYAASMRLSIVVPVIVMSLVFFGWRAILRPDRLFLLTYGICLTLFSLIWHPNLGIHQDWDLFSLDAVPYFLLVCTWLPQWVPHAPRRMILGTLIFTGMFTLFPHVLEHSRFGYRDYGSANVQIPNEAEAGFTMNGKSKPFEEHPLLMNTYSAKIIDRTHRQVFDFKIRITPDTRTSIIIPNSPSNK